MIFLERRVAPSKAFRLPSKLHLLFRYFFIEDMGMGV
jgi:hypothetical protein